MTLNLRLHVAVVAVLAFSTAVAFPQVPDCPESCSTYCHIIDVCVADVRAKKDLIKSLDAQVGSLLMAVEVERIEVQRLDAALLECQSQECEKPTEPKSSWLLQATTGVALLLIGFVTGHLVATR